LEGVCPYFLARRFLLKANIIVFNYSYMLDPKIANIVSAEMQKDSVIIFDECHNIDNVCIESFSLNINNRILDQANLSINILEQQIKKESISNTEEFKIKCQEEIDKLT
jgi:DNA excision repair protein ERCC-2